MGKMDLSPAQQSQILRSAFALDHPETFAAQVRQRLAVEPEIGDGLVFRICRAVQPAYFTPPPDAAFNGNRQPRQLQKLR